MKNEIESVTKDSEEMKAELQSETKESVEMKGESFTIESGEEMKSDTKVGEEV